MQLYLTSQEYAAMLGTQIGHSTAHKTFVEVLKSGQSIQEARHSLSASIENVNEIIERQYQQNETLHEIYDMHLLTIRNSCRNVLSSCLSLLTDE